MRPKNLFDVHQRSPPVRRVLWPFARLIYLEHEQVKEWCMGLLIDGEWRDKWYDTESTGGKFERSTSKFRNWVTADGSAGPSGKSGFQAQSGRYHLYVSYACPWAHRA